MCAGELKSPSLTARTSQHKQIARPVLFVCAGALRLCVVEGLLEPASGIVGAEWVRLLQELAAHLLDNAVGLPTQHNRASNGHGTPGLHLRVAKAHLPPRPRKRRRCLYLVLNFAPKLKQLAVLRVLARLPKLHADAYTRTRTRGRLHAQTQLHTRTKMAYRRELAAGDVVKRPVLLQPHHHLGNLATKRFPHGVLHKLRHVVHANQAHCQCVVHDPLLESCLIHDRAAPLCLVVQRALHDLHAPDAEAVLQTGGVSRCLHAWLLVHLASKFNLIRGVLFSCNFVASRFARVSFCAWVLAWPSIQQRQRVVWVSQVFYFRAISSRCDLLGVSLCARVLAWPRQARTKRKPKCAEYTAMHHASHSSVETRKPLLEPCLRQDFELRAVMSICSRFAFVRPPQPHCVYICV